MAIDYMSFECMACGEMFERTWFDMARGYQRVHYNSPNAVDEVETALEDGIGVFCSRACLEAGRGSVMQEHGVPIPACRPEIGPVETCAKCSGPVDMGDWHLTFTEGKMEDQKHSVSVIEFDYVAVVCKRCSPSQLAGSASPGVDAERSEVV